VNVLRAALVWSITAYQRVISPLTPRHCKYEPTCSRYGAQAVSEFGILRGLVLTGWRVLRCNPFSHGGFDPVSAQRLFRGPATNPSGSPDPSQS
jgi:putative membrane protein insertion efficiency factor